MQATDEPADFVASANPEAPFAFVNAFGLTNIAIVGAGTIDGAGPSLEYVRLSAPIGLTIRNAKSVELRQVTIEVQKGEPLIFNSAEVRKF